MRPGVLTLTSSCAYTSRSSASSFVLLSRSPLEHSPPSFCLDFPSCKHVGCTQVKWHQHSELRERTSHSPRQGTTWKWCRYDERVSIAVTHEGVKLSKPFPKEGSVYDYVYSLESSSWKEWLDVVPAQQLHEDMQFHDITVMTLDVVRYTYLINTFVQSHAPVLLVGPTGTGKSVYMKDYLMHRLDKASWTYMAFGFSAQTSVNMTQVRLLPGRAVNFCRVASGVCAVKAANHAGYHRR